MPDDPSTAKPIDADNADERKSTASARYFVPIVILTGRSRKPKNRVLIGFFFAIAANYGKIYSSGVACAAIFFVRQSRGLGQPGWSASK